MIINQISIREYHKRENKVLQYVGDDVMDLFKVSGLNIQTDLRYFNWSGVSFKNCDLTGCDFTGAILEGCDFRGAKISQAVFDKETRESKILNGAIGTPLKELAPSVDFFNIKSISKLKEYLHRNKVELTTDHVNHLIKYSENWDSAQESFQLFDLKELQPDIKTFEMLSHHAHNIGGERDANILLQGLIAKASRYNVKPNSIIYSKAIRTCKKYSEAIKITKEMKRKNISLDASSYAALIALSPNFQNGVKLFREMYNKNNIEPTELVYRELIRLAASYTQAVKYLKDMDNRNVTATVETYNAWLTTIAEPKRKNELGKLYSAQKIIGLMEKAKIKPNDKSYEELFRVSPNFSKTYHLLNTIQSKGIWPNHNIMVYSAKQVKGTKEANILRSVFTKNRYLPAQFFEEVYKVLCKHLTAEKLLGWAYSNFSSRSRPKDSAFGTAISVYSKNEQIEDALRIASAFPFLPEARKLFAKHKKKSLTYLAARFANDEEPHHASNALGVAYQTYGLHKEAITWLEKSLECDDTTEIRRKKIRARIKQLEERI